jgi:hypothetical protein
MNHKIFVFAVLFLTGILPSRLLAQLENADGVEISSDDRGWVFGLNMGVYLPSKATAGYYDGSSKNENNAAYVMSNYYWYQEIYNALGAHDSISISGLPQNMHYKGALQPALYGEFAFNSRVSLTIQFSYMKLKANDVIIFEVDPKPYATEPDLRLYPIRGVEERIYADIGLKKTYPRTSQLAWFLNGGLNINSTQVKKCSFYIEDKEYSMINNYNNGYIPNGNNQTFNVYQGGIGIGMFAGGGVSFRFPNGIMLEPGINGHWLMVNLEGYKNMTPGIGSYVRFLF